MPAASRRRRALLAAIAVAGGILGGAVGLRLAGPDVDDTELGSVRARVALSTPERRGIEIYVPLADWGVRANVFGPLVRIELEPRAPVRTKVADAVSGDRELLARTRRQVDGLMRAALARAVLWALVGALVGGLLALLVWERLGVRGRTLALAPGIAAGTLLIVVLGGGVWALATYEAERLEHPTYFAGGEELDRLLEQADELRVAGGRYSGQVQSALGAILALTNAESAPAAATRRAVLASDLHSNALALPVLERYADGLPLFMPGDFSVNGSRLESSLLEGIERAGRPVVMTSGNHDSQALMRSFAARGAVVLTRRGRLRGDGEASGPPVVSVAGLRVAGFEDPLAFGGESFPSGVRAGLSFTDFPDGEERFREAADTLWRWWQELPERPELLMLHQAALARDLAARIAAAEPGGPALAILAGHTHAQRVDVIGQVTVVDSGSVGAGGPFGAGKDDIGLAVLHFSERPGRLRSADLASIDPRDGSAQADRVIIDSPRCDDELVYCAAAP